MRARIFVFVVGGASLMLVALAWMHFTDPNPGRAESPLPIPAEAAQISTDTSAGVSALPAPEPAVSAVPPSASGNGEGSPPPPSPQARLIELSSRNDPESLREILTEMTSPEPALRKAALEAARQFGSRDAIPFLNEVADRTDDPREKVKILDAIDYLKMPSLTELRATAGQSGPEGQ
jgi:hypothetical protein